MEGGGVGRCKNQPFALKIFQAFQVFQKIERVGYVLNQLPGHNHINLVPLGLFEVKNIAPQNPAAAGSHQPFGRKLVGAVNPDNGRGRLRQFPVQPERGFLFDQRRFIISPEVKDTAARGLGRYPSDSWNRPGNADFFKRRVLKLVPVNLRAPSRSATLPDPAEARGARVRWPRSAPDWSTGFPNHEFSEKA